MRLYAGTISQFYEDTVRNQIADIMSDAWKAYYRGKPGPAEYASWQNSLRALKDVMQLAELKDQGVMLEYHLPSSGGRIDCLLTGRNDNSRDNAILIELKQWSKVSDSIGENEVMTYVGGSMRNVLHPCAQVGQYNRYLQDGLSVFYEEKDPIGLQACAYLHNYSVKDDDHLLDDKFASCLEQFPLFWKERVEEFASFLNTGLRSGRGMEILARIDSSPIRPSKMLMQHVADVIDGESRFNLIDEQQVAYDMVLAAVTEAKNSKPKSKGAAKTTKAKKTVVLVKGGPGTGKSVIAINLMSELLKQGRHVRYATGSRAFTMTLRNIIARERGQDLFGYFNHYVHSERNSVDVIIADEAHRLRAKTVNRFDASQRSELPQVEEIIRSAVVPVFLIDDNQIVRPDEIGSVEHIKEHAHQMGCEIIEIELSTQFRCAGSDAFLSWLNNTLEIEKTPHILWTGKDGFDFRVVDSITELDELIHQRLAEGHSARLVAGYCWPWSANLSKNGELIEDIVIGTFRRPWNARPEMSGLPKGVPKSHYWAYQKGGENQVGCIYTAQGFEFEYVGVIVGKDLVYRFANGQWVGQREESCDSTIYRRNLDPTERLKNTYRVLMSRGMKGCYVHFLDKETENYVKSRIDIER